MVYHFGVLAVEVGYRSGAGLTINLAKQQEKKAFCIPCNLTNSKSRTNELIQEGAKLVITPQEIIDECGISIESIKNNTEFMQIAISKEYREIYDLLENEPKNLDELSKLLNIPINIINSKITLMEIEGLVKQLPGSIFKVI